MATAKELVLREVPTWSEEQAERALRAVHNEGHDIDEWGDLDAQTDATTALAMRDLDAEEAAVGFSWKQRPA